MIEFIRSLDPEHVRALFWCAIAATALAYFTPHIGDSNDEN